MAPAARAARKPQRHEVRNNTQGWIGVMTIDRKGDERSVNIEPLGRRFMTDEEIQLTKEVQARRSNDPFAPRPLEHRDIATGEVIWQGTLPMLEVGPEGDPPYAKVYEERRQAAIAAAAEAGANEELGVPVT